MNNQLLNNQPEFTKEIIETLLVDENVRRAVTRESHYMFFHLYFSNYVKYPTALFQKEMFAITENDADKMAIIVAFRGSAKSTIMTMSYPLWAILGRMQKKCVMILSQTQQQAKLHLTNVKRELEGNELLRNDLGPFQEESDEWGAYSLVIPRYDAKIIAASSEQSIRGIRHGAHRPDLIICDDVEDLQSVKTRESRAKTYAWFKGEIVPCGDLDTKIVLVGNLLHRDSLLMRLKSEIEDKKIRAIFKEYPMVDENDVILWPGKYKNLEDVTNEKKIIGDEVSWQREYMLKIISTVDQVFKPEWIQYYDELPPERVYRYDVNDDYRYTAVGIDLAISEKETADYTAVVMAKIHGGWENLRIYILPNILNKRLDFPDAIREVGTMITLTEKRAFQVKVYVEDVGYQRAFTQSLKIPNLHVEGVSPKGLDKRERLSMVSNLVRNGNVRFPRHGSEELIQQLLYFGVEKHDDLADAFSIMLLQIIETDHGPVVISDIRGIL